MRITYFTFTLFLLIPIIITTSDWVCPQNMMQDGSLCYHMIENTGFPFQCPLKSTFSYEDNFTFISVLDDDLDTWVTTKRNEIHGYFEFPKLHFSYGHLFSTLIGIDGNNYEDCVIRRGNYALRTKHCTSVSTGLCLYSHYDMQFCQVYNKICNISSDCHCHSDRVAYLCQTGCQDQPQLMQGPKPPESQLALDYHPIDDANHEESMEPEPKRGQYNPQDKGHSESSGPGINNRGNQGIGIQSVNVCSTCDKIFERYPQPEITLKFDRNTIIITIRNPLKLIMLPYALPFYCFSDVHVPSASRIRYRFFNHELLEEESIGKLTYIIRIDPPAVGFYWCEGFSLPELEKVESNKILVGSRFTYGLNLVLNFTIEEFNLLPYDVHVASIYRLRNIIGTTRYQLIRPPEPPILSHNRTKAHLTLHMTTNNLFTNAEVEYKTLSMELMHCNSVGLWNCSLAFSDLCLPVNTIVNYSIASWPKVFLGQSTPPQEIFLQVNGLPIIRRCVGSFMKGAHWSDIIGEISTSSGSNITIHLHELLNSNKTAEELNKNLRDIIYDVKHVIVYDVYLVARILERIAQSQEPFDLHLFIQNVDKVTEIDLDVLQRAQNDLNATDIILYNIDLALSAIAGQPTAKTIKANNLMTLVMGLNISNEDQRGFGVYQLGEELKFTMLKEVSSIEDIDFKNLRLATFIPFHLMKQILWQNETPSLIAVIYLTDALFRSDRNKLGMASFALGIYVTGFAGDLGEPLPVIFDANFEPEGNFYCAFWEFGIDEMLVAIRGRWQKTGPSNFHRSLKLCGFSHMTHFALLANAPRNYILDLISLIGCTLSMLGVIGIFITAMASKTWRDSATTKILLNFSATIFVQMLLLFLWHVNRSRLLCKIISIGLHYIILSQFCWILMIGYLQYRKFVQVLAGKSTKFLFCSYLICWLIPIVPVLVIYVLYPESYTTQNYCHVSGLGLYFGLLAPIAFIVIINVMIFILIFGSLAQNKTVAFGHRDRSFRDKVRIYLLLFFLFGFSWIFGLLAHLFKSIVLSYLFCVTATLQGFVLYVYFVLCEKSTRQFWAKQFRCCRRASRERKSSDTQQIAKCNNSGSENQTSNT